MEESWNLLWARTRATQKKARPNTFQDSTVHPLMADTRGAPLFFGSRTVLLALAPTVSPNSTVGMKAPPREQKSKEKTNKSAATAHFTTVGLR